MKVKGIYRIRENKSWDLKVLPKERTWKNNKIKFLIFSILFRFLVKCTNICILLKSLLLPLFIIKGRGAVRGVVFGWSLTVAYVVQSP